jgi:hypothetical protein
MRRRQFIARLGSVAASPLTAQAQQSGRMRRIGVLMNLAADDSETLRRMAAFRQGLQELGWADGRNLQFDFRYGLGEADRYRRYAAELVALAPDVILAQGGVTVGPLLQVTRALPIVFVNTNDPVGSGYVASLARPGSNATGFMTFEYSRRRAGELAFARFERQLLQFQIAEIGVRIRLQQLVSFRDQCCVLIGRRRRLHDSVRTLLLDGAVDALRRDKV